MRRYRVCVGQLSRTHALGLAALAVAAAAPSALRVGFLSDDWLQLELASRIGWLDPLVSHHAAPLLTALYKSVHAGWLDARSWHALVLALHAINVALVCRMAQRLGRETGPALAAGALVALAPGGLEAVLWTAASPFVPLLTLILLALGPVIAALAERRALRRAEAAGVALAQLAAFLVWDWAIVLLPLLAAVALAYAPHVAALRRVLPGLAATMLVWAACLAARSSGGAALGYGLFPIGASRAVLLLGAQPTMQLAPQLPKELVVALAAPCLAVLGRGALRDASVRALLAAFAVLQLPWFFQGAPASRYAYLSLAFLVPALVFAARTWLTPRAARIALAASLALGAWGYARIGSDWIAASRDAARIGAAIEAHVAALDPATPVVVVNLPDHAAAAHGLWPPPLWRNGLSTLRPGAEKVFTPEHAERFEPHAPRIVARDAIASAFAGALLLEVVTEIHDGSATYEVVPFR